MNSYTLSLTLLLSVVLLSSQGSSLPTTPVSATHSNLKNGQSLSVPSSLKRKQQHLTSQAPHEQQQKHIAGNAQKAPIIDKGQVSPKAGSTVPVSLKPSTPTSNINKQTPKTSTPVVKSPAGAVVATGNTHPTPDGPKADPQHTQANQEGAGTEHTYSRTIPGDVLLAAMFELMAEDLAAERRGRVADHYPDAVPIPTTLHKPTTPYTPTSTKTQISNVTNSKNSTASSSIKTQKIQQNSTSGSSGVSTVAAVASANKANASATVHRALAVDKKALPHSSRNTSSLTHSEKMDKLWKEASMDALVVAVPTVFLMLLLFVVVLRFTTCCCCWCCRQEMEVCVPNTASVSRGYAPLNYEEEDEEGYERPGHKRDFFTETNVLLPKKSTGTADGSGNGSLAGTRVFDQEPKS